MRGGDLLAGEGGDQVAEQPRAPEATASDDDAVAPGLLHHRQRVGRLPDVAVAEHRDLGNGLFQCRNRFPSRRARVVLLYGPGVQGDGRDSGLGRRPAGVEERNQVVVDADTELAGDRHAVRDRTGHGLTQNLPHQPALDRDGRAATAAGDLGRRAAEVQIDMVDAASVAQAADRLADDRRVAAVDLQAAGVLVRPERGQFLGLGVVVEQRHRHDHLVDVEQPGPEPAAERPERGVRHTGHRRQHDRGGQLERADAQRGHRLSTLPSGRR